MVHKNFLFWDFFDDTEGFSVQKTAKVPIIPNTFKFLKKSSCKCVPIRVLSYSLALVLKREVADTPTGVVMKG